MEQAPSCAQLHHSVKHHAEACYIVSDIRGDYCSNHYGTGHDVLKATFGVHEFKSGITNDFAGRR